MSEPSWDIYVHPACLEQVARYKSRALLAQTKVGSDWAKTTSGKKYLALSNQMQVVVPANPGSPHFRQGNTLGPRFKHWLRAKFLSRYRLFFRYSSLSKIIVYGWVNDDESLRSYNSESDAYTTFRKMLEAGKVPNSWDELVAEAKKLS